MNLLERRCRRLRDRFRRGVKYVPIPRHADDRRWIEARQFTVEEICRIARVRTDVPPELVRRCAVRRFDQLRIAWAAANNRRYTIAEQWQMVRLCVKRWLFGRSSAALQTKERPPTPGPLHDGTWGHDPKSTACACPHCAGRVLGAAQPPSPEAFDTPEERRHKKLLAMLGHVKDALRIDPLILYRAAALAGYNANPEPSIHNANSGQKALWAEEDADALMAVGSEQTS